MVQPWERSENLFYARMRQSTNARPGFGWETATGLKRLARGAHEVAQNRDIRPVGADSSGIHRQAQTFRQVQVQTRIVKLRQTKSSRRQNTIYARRVDRPGRTVTLPGAARQFVKLLPIAFVPGSHLLFVACNTRRLWYRYTRFKPLDAPLAFKVRPVLVKVCSSAGADETARATDILHNPRNARYFLPSLFQTRHYSFCFDLLTSPDRPVGADSATI